MGNVLVVEDEVQVLVLAEGILQDAGHCTFTATDEIEGLAVIDGSDRLELLFTDINLKGNEHGGLGLAREATQRRAGLHVLYTTGGQITDGMRALFVEGSGVLPKPYQPAELISAVERLLGPPAA